MSDDLLERLRGFEKAYPESVFVPPTREQRKRLHEKEPGLQDCIAADMARHLVERAITPAADEIEALRAELNNAAEATGIAGVDKPMSLLECIQSLRAELTAKDKLIEDANSHHVEMQRHRDAWRKYAYGRGERPQDFLDGNMVPSDRGPTRIEELEAASIVDFDARDRYLTRIEELEERWRLAQASMAMDKSRIEELMNYPGRVVLLYEQIDAAWGDVWHDGRPILKELFSIVACEECGGSGKTCEPSYDFEDAAYPDWQTCHSCHGHGWVINNKDVINQRSDDNKDVI